MNQKNRIIYPGLLFISLLSFGSCISPVTPHLNAEDSKHLLVVDGQITNQEGPFRVKLTTTVPVSNYFDPNPVTNADVMILDDQGHSFQLYGNNKGLYETTEKNLKGIPGNKYTLKVTTLEDGLQYTSTPVLMQEVPGIDSLYFEEVTRPRFLLGSILEENWLNILLDTKDAEGKNKYWRFAFEETWEVCLLNNPAKVNHSQTFPDNFTLMEIIKDDHKNICWVTEPSATIMVAGTENSPEDEIKRFPVQSLGPFGVKLHTRYSILVKQYSIDHDLYNYLNQLKAVSENSGGLYSKIPAPVYGNITCCDSTTKALGYFSASSVREKRLFINGSEHHVETVSVDKSLRCSWFDYSLPSSVKKYHFGYYLILLPSVPPTIDTVHVYATTPECAACTEFGTNVKPSFW